MTVTALMRVSPTKYLSRSSCSFFIGTRSVRCFFAARLSSSNSLYVSVRKSRSSVLIRLLDSNRVGPDKGHSRELLLTGRDPSVHSENPGAAPRDIWTSNAQGTGRLEYCRTQKPV